MRYPRSLYSTQIPLPYKPLFTFLLYIYAHNKLKELRLQRGLKQEEVAIWLSPQCAGRISRWEHGTAFPSAKNLFKLAQIYKVIPHTMYPDLFREEELAFPLGMSGMSQRDQPWSPGIV